jgi:RHS repeat-associated protein
LTDANGNVISRRDFHPFGVEIITALRTQGLGYTADAVRQKFTSYERDIESGLDYAKARMFGSSYGRFTSPDPLLGSARIENPQTLNRYVYVLNNPLVLTDPTGLWEWGDLAGGSATDEQLEANSHDNTLKKAERRKARDALAFRKRFRESLASVAKAATSNKLTQKQRDAVSRAVNSYGKEGDGNNVIVAFAERQATGIGATTDGTLGDLIFVNFDKDKKGNALAIDIAHEGSHVADNQDFDAIANLGMCGANSANITLLESETRAYNVTSFTAQALGVSPVFDFPNETKYHVWNSGWKEADRDRKRAAGITNLLNTFYSDPSSKNRFGDIEIRP